jgi:putative alpha-1,2-mannosidase
LTIRAENQSPGNVYVLSVLINGTAIDRLFLEHEELAAGGEIVFVMGPEPNRPRR